MVSAKDSRLLAKVKQVAILNKDKKMIEKLEKVKKSTDITVDIKKYIDVRK